MPPPANDSGVCPPNTNYVPCMGPKGKAYICDPAEGYKTKDAACDSDIMGQCPDQYSCEDDADGNCPAGRRDDGKCHCPHGHSQLLSYCDNDVQQSLRSDTKSFFENHPIKISGIVAFVIIIIIVYVYRKYKTNNDQGFFVF